MEYVLSEQDRDRIQRLLQAWDNGRLNPFLARLEPEVGGPTYTILATATSDITPYDYANLLPGSGTVRLDQVDPFTSPPNQWDASPLGAVNEDGNLADTTVFNLSPQFIASGSVVQLTREPFSGYWILGNGTYIFPVKLTDVQTHTDCDNNAIHYYEWRQQRPDPCGELVDAVGGLSGTAADPPVNPLVELNNQYIAVSPFAPLFAWARFRGIVDGQPMYDFDSGLCCIQQQSSSSSSSSSAHLSSSSSSSSSSSASSSGISASSAGSESGSGPSGSGGGCVQVVTDTTCDPVDGLQVTFSTLCGTVTIGGQTYTVNLTLQ